MRRATSTSRLGNGTRVQVILQTDECRPTDRAYRFLQFELLQAIANDPALTQCGTSHFDTLNVRHDGKCWVAVAEAVVGESNAAPPQQG